MGQIERFGVSMERGLLKRFDDLLAGRGYGSRSEGIRDLVRKELVGEEWAEPGAEVIATVSIVYPHHEHHLADALTDLQHRHHASIVSSTHVHLDTHNCLEVIIVKGPSEKVRGIAAKLVSTRGVRHGGVIATTTGKRFR